MSKVFMHYPIVVGLIAATIATAYGNNPLDKTVLPILLGVTLAVYIVSILVSKYLLLQMYLQQISPVQEDPGSLLLKLVSPFIGLLYVVAFILMLINPLGKSTVFMSVWAAITAIGYMVECI